MLGRVVFCALVYVVIASAVDEDKQARILRFKNENDGKGNYEFSFETSNGIIRTESGMLINEGQPDQFIYVQGYVSYRDANGKLQRFRYVADTNGYQILPNLNIVIYAVSDCSRLPQNRLAQNHLFIDGILQKKDMVNA